MPQFRTTLARTFAVTIDASNETEAKRLVELFVGYQDDSMAADRARFGFDIKEIEMTLNEAIESEKVPTEQ
jgi:hypothetical protein